MPALLVCLTAAIQSFAPVLAGSPLENIPAEVAGVVVLPRPAVTAERLSEFARRVEPEFRGIDWTLLSDAMDLWPDCWDTTQPIAFVMTDPSFEFLVDPEFSSTRTVLVFTPRDPVQFKKLLRHRPESVQRIERAGRRYYVMMRDGYAFYGGNRKALRIMRRVRADSSLYAALDAEEKAALKDSDVFVHLPLAAWRDRLNFLALLATNMARMGAVEQDPKVAAVTKAMFDYISVGVRNIITDMQSLTLAIGYDGTAFKLVHHHGFREGGAVAAYLRKVKRTGMEPYDLMPDRPFFMLGAFDWRTSPQDSISVKLVDHVFAQDLGEEGLTPEVRRDMGDAARACYNQIEGTFFMVAPATSGQLSPIDLFGGYAVRNSDDAMKQLRLLQARAGHLTGGLVSGVYPGEFKRRIVGGVEFDEMRLALDQMPASVRDQVLAMYGEGVLLQEMALGDDRILQTMTSRGASVLDMVSARKSGKSLEANAAVARVRGRLPDKPYGVVIFDLGRSFAVLPHFVLESAKGRAAFPLERRASFIKNDYDGASGVGPLLGWSCTLGPRSLSGCFVISADDAIAAAEQAKNTLQHLSGALGKTDINSVPLATP